ncbi:anthocyanidin 3-O-glucosyltransferase 4-like [Phoenix dactylifera]|uniref:Glycosyltransferase n=1 Tax=Phoenix dactylifera TaxID=42345 RepID=A0A8B7C991_PHODC|nr:anthocyanidin 3-O-glucosyltransferase 4-like [Phoenix dactylifera]
MNPMIDIACLLAEHHVTVTVLTTPANASRIRSTIDRISNSALPIQFIPLHFPGTEVGLPEGCENMDSITSTTMITTFLSASKLMRKQMVHHLHKLKPAPSCIITGMGFAWTYKIAREFGVPCFLFHGFSCFSLFCLHNLHLYKSHQTASSPTEPFLLPGLPHRFEITRSQLPLYFQLLPQHQETCDEQREGELAVDGEVVNSFGELEQGYAERLEATTGKKVWTVGPVSLYNKGRSEMAERGKKSLFDVQCLNWLDSKKPQSVVYVSFGSMGRFTPEQMMELGSGLLASNRPFIWVIREGERSSEEVEDWLMEKLEKNADSRCLLIRGWAPQVMILAHPAVGGFVTHCGWNSTLEAVSSGLPMVTWPLFAEQFLNEKLIVDVLGIGVVVGVRTATEWGRGGEDGVLVGREAVAMAVERLMDGGEEGKERTRKAKELGEKAKKALEKDGSSYSSMTNLIQYVAERSAKRAGFIAG